MTSATPTTPPRGVSLITATAIVIANMVGTGIFTSLGYQVTDLPTGFSIVTLWAIGGLCAFCGALAYGELAAALPRSGGEYQFLSRAYHPCVGFVAGTAALTRARILDSVGSLMRSEGHGGRLWSDDC